MSKAREAITRYAEDAEIELVLISEDYDDCIIGIVESYEGSAVAYSKQKMISKLMEGMTREEAEDSFEFTYIGFHVSSTANPVFLSDIRYLEAIL